MIPYNPSSFDRNKTILEQILELKNWLKEHPSYKVYQCFANYMPNQFTSYAFGQLAGDIQTIEAMAVGDVVFFADSYYAVITAVDLDNQDFDIQSAVSFKGPQGPAGTNGVSVTTATINGSGHLILTLSDGTSIDAGMSKGADGTNGTNGTNGVDGAYVSTASVDGNGDLQITIYDPATSTSSTINAGYVVGPAGQGMQVINTTTSTGTLSASDLAKANGTDDCILIFTDNGADLTMQRILKDSSNVYFYAHFVDTGKASFLLCEVDAVTGAYNIDGGDLPIKASNIDSENATSGQVLQADGSGGASWQNAGGGSFTHYAMVTSTSGTLSQSDYDNLIYEDSVLIHKVNSTTINIFRKISDDGSHINFEYINVAIGTLRFIIDKVSRAYSRTTYGFRSGSIDSQTATNGQVLMANGSGGASWQNASGGTTLNKYEFNFSNNWTELRDIVNNAKGAVRGAFHYNNYYGALSFGHPKTAQYIVFSGIGIKSDSTTDTNLLHVVGDTGNNNINLIEIVNGTATRTNITSMTILITYWNDTQLH